MAGLFIFLGPQAINWGRGWLEGGKGDLCNSVNNKKYPPPQFYLNTVSPVCGSGAQMQSFPAVLMGVSSSHRQSCPRQSIPWVVMKFIPRICR